MGQTAPQLHHGATDLISESHIALMVMHRRRGAAMRAKMQAASMMAILDTGAVVPARGGGAFGMGWAPAEARHE